MAKVCSFISVLAVAIVCISVCSLTSAASSAYGDAIVKTFKDSDPKNQLNIYQGDQFILNLSFKKYYRGDPSMLYKDLTLLNLTQSVSGISADVNIILTRADNGLFTVTSVSPVTSKFGRSATLLSSSLIYNRKYSTELSVQNSANETIPLTYARELTISSHALATNPGILVQITPFGN